MRDTLTPDELKQARELCEAATRGDWHAGDCIQPRVILYAVPKHRPLLTDDTITLGHTYCDIDGQGRANMKFIAAARSLVPRLLDEVERLRAEVDRQRGWIAGLDAGLADASIAKQTAEAIAAFVDSEVTGAGQMLDGALLAADIRSGRWRAP